MDNLEGNMEEKNIINYHDIRVRINNYVTIIQICLVGFSHEHLNYLEGKERSYLQKIEEGRAQLFILLTELDLLILDKKADPNVLAKYRHDLRLAINVIQGYSEVIQEELYERTNQSVGGNFTLIADAAREILKNVDFIDNTCLN
jgi:signal transduction histidine kinase